MSEVPLHQAEPARGWSIGYVPGGGTAVKCSRLARNRLRDDRFMVGVPREQKMLKRHLPRVICHQVYWDMKILSNLVEAVESSQVSAPSAWVQILIVGIPDVYQTGADSGDLRYKSMGVEKLTAGTKYPRWHTESASALRCSSGML